MKRILKVLVIFIFVVILSGCDSKSEEKVVKCMLDQNNEVYGYKLHSEYNIYTDGNVVNQVESEEVATSDNDEILDYLANYTNTLYTNMNNAYGGYEFKVTKEDGKLVSKAKIDYANLDKEKLAKDQPTMKNYMNDDYMLTLEGIKQIYEQMGATCED